MPESIFLLAFTSSFYYHVYIPLSDSVKLPPFFDLDSIFPSASGQQ